MPGFNGLSIAKEIKFLPEQAMEGFNTACAEEKNAISVRNMLRFLFMGSQESILPTLTYDVIRNVLYTRNPILLKLMKQEFKQAFYYIFKQISRSENPIHPEQAILYLSNCLNILPFAGIEESDVFEIPVWLHGKWELVSYAVKPIELTDPDDPDLTPAKRVFAYALNPINNSEAWAHIIFKGTTYPGDDGFWAQVMSDLKPGQTPGQDLYSTAYKRLESWLDEQEKKVHVCGMSLGGSLALLFAMHQGNKIKRVDALNPAGLHSLCKEDNQYDYWDDFDEKPDVIIQKQGNDPISALGFWKKEWVILEVTATIRIKFLIMLDHALIYTGVESTQFKLIDTEEDNQRRALRTHVFLGSGRICLDLMCIQPVEYIKNNRLSLCLMGLSGALFCALQPQLLIFIAMPWLIQVFMFSVVSGHVLSEVSFFAQDCYERTKKGQFSKALDWAGEQPRVIQGAIALVSFSLLLLPVMYPAMVLSLSFLIAAIPCVLRIVQGISGYCATERGDGVDFISDTNAVLS